MAGRGITVGELQDSLKDLRKYGFFEKIDEAGGLLFVMGCQENNTKEQKASCFIALVKRFIYDTSNAEILLAAVGLLDGYQDVKGLNKRRRLYYDSGFPAGKWKRPEDSLADIEDKAIKHLVTEIVSATALPLILPDKPTKLVLPAPQYLNRYPAVKNGPVSVAMTKRDGEAIAEQIKDSITNSNIALAEALGEQTKVLEELRDYGNKQSAIQTTAGEYPLYVAVPCLFSPITISAKHHVLYQCGYDDRSAVIIKGSYGLGQFAVISNDYVLRMEPLNKISDIPQSLKDAVVKIITGLGSGFSNKKIGFTYGHKETTRVETLNAGLKGMLLAQDLRIEKCSHEMFFTCDVLIVSSPLEPLTEDEQAALLGYITNGGSVLFCGIGYYWVAFNDENGAKRKIEDFPINKLGKFLGFQIEPSYIGKSIHYERETNKIPLYFTPLQLSGENPIVSADEKIMAIIKGALTNDPAEQGKLGLLFEIGRGLPKNLDYALYWYKMASFRNAGAAQYMLAALYEKTSDFLFTIWLLISAGNGYYIALGRLGFAYYDGKHGLQKNEKMGIDCIKQAAEKGWGNAIYRLGVIALDKGMYKEAGVWFTKICYGKNIGERFITEAHYQLGVLFRDGKGFDKDLYKAREHFVKAAKSGHNGAKTAGSLLDAELKSMSVRGLLGDEEATASFSMATFKGTPYNDLEDSIKKKILLHLETELELWIGNKLDEYLTDEQLSTYDKILQRDAETIKFESQRLGVVDTSQFKELKAMHPLGDEICLLGEILAEMWIVLYAPSVIFGKEWEVARLKKLLVSGELDISKI